MSKFSLDDVASFDRELHKKAKKVNSRDGAHQGHQKKKARHSEHEQGKEEPLSVYRDRATERRSGNSDNASQSYEDALRSLQGVMKQVGPPGVPMRAGGGPPGVPMSSLKKREQVQNEGMEEVVVLRERSQARELLTLEDYAVMKGHKRDAIGTSELGAQLKSLVVSPAGLLVDPSYAQQEDHQEALKRTISTSYEYSTRSATPTLVRSSNRYHREQAREYVSCRFSGPEGVRDRLMGALARLHLPREETLPETAKEAPTASAPSRTPRIITSIYDDSDEEVTPSAPLPHHGNKMVSELGLFQKGEDSGGGDEAMDKATVLKSMQAVVDAANKGKGDKRGGGISLTAPQGEDYEDYDGMGEEDDEDSG